MGSAKYSKTKQMYAVSVQATGPHQGWIMAQILRPRMEVFEFTTAKSQMFYVILCFKGDI